MLILKEHIKQCKRGQMKTIVRNIILIITFSIEISSVKAQSFHFSKMPPIGIPQFSKIYVDPTDSFWTIGIKADGGYGYYKSINGTDWYPTNKAFQPSTNYRGNLLKASNNILYSYAVVSYLSLARSIDNGTTWVDLTNKFPDTPGTFDSKIFIGEDGVLYLNSSNNYYALGSIKSIIYKSIDNGDSWIKIDESIKQYQSMQEYLNFGEKKIIYSTGFSSYGNTLLTGNSIDSANYLFTSKGLVRVGNTVLAGGVDSGMVYSNDTGRTWTSLSAKMFNATNASILFNKGDTFFVSTNLGNLFSFDKGQTWSKMSMQYECDTIESLTSVAANSRAIIGTNSETGYMIFDPLNNQFGEKKSPQFNPMDLSFYGDLNEELSAVVSKRIYTYSSNIWTPIACSTTTIPSPGYSSYEPNFIKKYNRIYSSGTFPLVSKDNGRNWNNLQFPTMDIDRLLHVVGQDSLIYITNSTETYDSIYLCDENGNIYQTNSVPLAINHDNGNRGLFTFDKRMSLFQDDYNGNTSLIISDDFGKSWINANLPWGWHPYEMLATSNYLFLHLTYGEFWYSSNGGMTWDSARSSIFPQTLNQVIEIPNKKGFYFQSDSSIYFINDLKNGDLVLVFQSHSNGIWDFQIINNHLYIQTGDNTIWYNSETAGIENVLKPVINDRLIIYPVPSKDLLNLTFNTNEIPVSYIIYNISGEQILKNKLNSSTQIDIKNLNEGIYFLQIIFSDNTSKYGKFIKD